MSDQLNINHSASKTTMKNTNRLWAKKNELCIAFCTWSISWFVFFLIFIALTQSSFPLYKTQSEISIYYNFWKVPFSTLHLHPSMALKCEEQLSRIIGLKRLTAIRNGYESDFSLNLFGFCLLVIWPFLLSSLVNIQSCKEKSL